MRPVIWFDIETDGLRPDAQIISLAAIATINGRITDRFYKLIQFDDSISEPAALKVNGYTKEGWATAFSLENVLKDFQNFCWPTSDVCGGFNIVQFDIPRLNDAMKSNSLQWPFSWYMLDVYQLAMWLQRLGVITSENLKLTTLCKTFGIQYNPHDPLEDVQATYELAKKLIPLFKRITK